jgi:hypothetical protein
MKSDATVMNNSRQTREERAAYCTILLHDLPVNTGESQTEFGDKSLSSNQKSNQKASKYKELLTNTDVYVFTYYLTNVANVSLYVTHITALIGPVCPGMVSWCFPLVVHRCKVLS